MTTAHYVGVSHRELARFPVPQQGLPSALKHPSDSELVARSKAGDVEAFGQLYARYERMVYRMAICMLGDPDEADDIKQNTFIKAYRAIESFRGDASFASWVLKVATNLCRDFLKVRGRRREVALVPAIEAQVYDPSVFGRDPARLYERQEFDRLVARVLAALPSNYREIIVLRDVEGLSYAQIGEVVGASTASVKLRLFRARRSLRERMDSVLNAR
jgi:RNA polymerase sigma-70 factor (ECF subfamily)